MADDDDSLLGRIDEIDDSLDMESDGENIPPEAREAANVTSSTRGSSPDITEALDYTEDPDEDEEDVDDDGEIEEEDGEEKSPEKSEKKEEEDGELEDGELEDGELEDSDEEEEDKEKPKRFSVPITAPRDGGGSGGRLPIEVGSSVNDNRLSRPLQRGAALPPIRNQPYLPRRDEPSESSFDSFLLEAKKVMNGETDEERTAIPSLLDIPTHRPPVKDLGPQCIYPSQRNGQSGQPQQHHNQNNRFKRDAGNQFQPKDSPMFTARGRTNSQNMFKAAPPPLMRRVESKSPPARGFSFSPTKFNAEDISSDSDEELFRKRSPKPIPMRKVLEKRKRSRSSSSGSSSSRATIPGVRSISSASSSDSDSSARRRRNRRRSRSSTRSRSRSRTYSPQPDSPKRRHMKRKVPNDTSPIRRSSRSRSPPPYPPGAQTMYQKKKKQDHLVTGDIHSYKIPKRGGSSSRDAPLFKKTPAQPAFLAGRAKTSSSSTSRDEKKDKKRRRRSETPPTSSKRRKERSRSREREKSRDSKKRKKRAQSESESDDSQSSYDSRKKSSRKSRKRSRKSPSVSSKSSRSRSTRSDSSRSASRSSRSASSDDSSKIPLRYRQQGSPPHQEKMSSDEDDELVIPKKELSSPENSPIRQRSETPKSRSVSPEVAKAASRSSSESPLLDATSPLDSLEGSPPPPPPEDESEDVPPPPAVTVSETRKQLKERLARIEKSLEIKKPTETA